MDLIFKTPPTPYRPLISYGPTAEQGYQVPRCAQDYEAVLVIIAAIEEPILDTRAATFPIGEMLVDPATARETLGEYIVPGNGITSSSAHYYGSTSVYLNEDASPLGFTSAGRAGRHPVASSIRVARAGRNRTRFSCRVCNVGFVQRQGLNRHNRDKHQPRNICPHCGVFKWSPARHYLLTKHFERDHPGVPLQVESRNDLTTNGDLRACLEHRILYPVTRVSFNNYYLHKTWLNPGLVLVTMLLSMHFRVPVVSPVRHHLFVDLQVKRTKAGRFDRSPRDISGIRYLCSHVHRPRRVSG
ncbi:hypothetical protein EDB89DRAFT_1175857 [Lactarius sanguifluus]|nr:hypothetical protein EDB89DRAFT_1175857 [Lactarius sanguifluus]